MYLSVSLLYYSLKFGILHIQCHFHYIYVHTSYTSRDFIFSYCCANDFQLQIFSSVSFSFHRFALLCFPYSSSSLLWKEIVMIHKTRNFYLYTFHILYYNLIYVCALKNYDSAFWYDNTANGKSEERKQASEKKIWYILIRWRWYKMRWWWLYSVVGTYSRRTIFHHILLLSFFLSIICARNENAFHLKYDCSTRYCEEQQRRKKYTWSKRKHEWVRKGTVRGSE